MATLIRPAVPADAPGIAVVHVKSWHETYTGLLPQEYLAARTNERARQIREKT